MIAGQTENRRCTFLRPARHPAQRRQCVRAEPCQGILCRWQTQDPCGTNRPAGHSGVAQRRMNCVEHSPPAQPTCPGCCRRHPTQPERAPPGGKSERERDTLVMEGSAEKDSLQPLKAGRQGCTSPMHTHIAVGAHNWSARILVRQGHQRLQQSPQCKHKSALQAAHQDVVHVDEECGALRAGRQAGQVHLSHGWVGSGWADTIKTFAGWCMHALFPN